MGDDAGIAGRAVTPGTVPDAATAGELDLRGEVCPYTFLKARLALDELPAGAVLRVLVDNETSARDVPRSLAGAGPRGARMRAAGERGMGDPDPARPVLSSAGRDALQAASKGCGRGVSAGRRINHTSGVATTKSAARRRKSSANAFMEACRSTSS